MHIVMIAALSSLFGSNSKSLTLMLPHLTEQLFNWRSFGILILVLAIGWTIGRVLAGILHQMSVVVGQRADQSRDLDRVNKLRRTETILIIAMALIRAIFIILAIYLWWSLTHPQQLTALLGASALILLLLSNIVSPVFRDLAFGGGMMAEKWFGVGDLITLQPYNIQGIVERVTLRSTRVRTLNGEVVWASNQNIGMVQVVPRGIHPIALELFVTGRQEAEELVEQVNNLLPQSTSMIITPLTIMESEERAPGVYHLTVLAEAAPWRDYLITTNAVAILKDLDSKTKKPILLAEPIPHHADRLSEREFAKSINNARKTRINRKLIGVPRVPQKRKAS